MLLVPPGCSTTPQLTGRESRHGQAPERANQGVPEDEGTWLPLAPSGEMLGLLWKHILARVRGKR